MPHIKTTLSTKYGDFDNTAAFVHIYSAVDDSTKNDLFAALTPTWSAAIENPFQFGHIISCLKDDQISKFYVSVIKMNPLFLKDAAELAQICAYLDPRKITLFCNIIKQQLDAKNFIDSPEKFSAIFSVFSIASPDGKEDQIRLNEQQLPTVFNIIKSKLFNPFFFRKLSDFVELFPLIPTTEDKIALLKTIENELPALVKTANDINHIQKSLQSSIATELALLKETRETIYRLLIIHDPVRLDKAFHAMLFLILDNYPGEQPDKLKNIIEKTFSDSSITELNTLLETTESEMRCWNENITSTRLQNALKYVITNLRIKGKKIDVDRVIELAKSKKPTINVGSFFETFAESEACAAAAPAAYQHEF